MHNVVTIANRTTEGVAARLALSSIIVCPCFPGGHWIEQDCISDTISAQAFAPPRTPWLSWGDSPTRGVIELVQNAWALRRRAVSVRAVSTCVQGCCCSRPPSFTYGHPWSISTGRGRDAR